MISHQRRKMEKIKGKYNRIEFWTLPIRSRRSSIFYWILRGRLPHPQPIPINRIMNWSQYGVWGLGSGLWERIFINLLPFLQLSQLLFPLLCILNMLFHLCALFKQTVLHTLKFFICLMWKSKSGNPHKANKSTDVWFKIHIFDPSLNDSDC